VYDGIGGGNNGISGNVDSVVVHTPLHHLRNFIRL
jgi:hypothetical protein